MNIVEYYQCKAIYMIYVSYRKIKECRSGFSTWLFYEWNFVNKYSIREWGVILFGVTYTNFSEDKPQRRKMVNLRKKQYAKIQKKY